MYLTGYIPVCVTVAIASLGPIVGLYLAMRRDEADVGSGVGLVVLIGQFGLLPAMFLISASLHVLFIGRSSLRPGFPVGRSTRLHDVVEIRPNDLGGRIIVERKNGSHARLLNVPSGVFGRENGFPAAACRQLTDAIEQRRGHN